MGAHSQPREGFNRTMAIAVAAGLAVTGGIQVAAPADSVFGAAAHAGDRVIDEQVWIGAEVAEKGYTTKVYPAQFTVNQARKLNAQSKPVVGEVGNRTNTTFNRGEINLRTIDGNGNVVDDGPSSTLGLVAGTWQVDLGPYQSEYLSMRLMEKPGLWGAELEVNKLSRDSGRGGYVPVNTYTEQDAWYKIIDYAPGYDGGTVAPGDTLEIPLINYGSEDAERVDFRLVNSFANNPYWDVHIGSKYNDRDEYHSGNLYVTLKEDAPLGSQILIPVEYSLYNGAGPETIYASVTSAPVTKGGDQSGSGANASGAAIKEVRDNKDGTFTLIRNDDTEVPGKINVGDGVKTITSGNDGTITLTYINGTQSKPIKLSQVGVTQSNPGKPDNKITLTVPGGQTVTFDASNTYVTDVKKNAQGNYDIYRSDVGDGKTVWKTIDLADLRSRIAALEQKDSPSRDEFKKVQDDIAGIKADVLQNAAVGSQNAKDILDLRKDVDALENRMGKVEDRLTKVEKASIKEVRDNKDGSYTIIRQDGTAVSGKIDGSGNVTGITPNKDGSVTLTFADGKKSDPVKLAQTTITETNKGKPDHKVVITSPNGQTVTLDAFDNYVTDVKKNAQGNYDIYRSDVGGGKTVWKTIDIKDLRDKVATLEKNDAPSRDEFKKVQDDIVGIKTDVLQNATDINKNTGDIVDLKREVSSLENRMGKVEDRLTKVEKASIKEIRDNKDGSFTIIRQDGTAVSGKIDGSGNVTGITPNKDGSVTLTFADGTKSDPVKLAQTTITETNKGKPDHKVTITSPNGQTVTLDAFDNYVTDVKKNAQGNYDIYRSDVGGGKTVWKTIDLADLRTAVKTLDDRAKKLETQGDSNTAQITNIKKEIARIDGEIKRVDGELSTLSERATASEDRLNTIESDITDIRSDILSVDLRVTSLEARVSEIEGRLNTGLGKCVGTVGSSLAALVPAVALASQFVGGSNIPAVDGAIANFQRQMGMFNPQMAQAVDRNRGAIAAGLAGLGLLALVFVPGTCGDASLGQAVAEPLSSARDARRAEREAARENGEGGSSIKVGADVAAGNGAGSSEQ